MSKRRRFADLHQAYWFLDNHAVRGYQDTGFLDALDIMVVKVDPKTNSVSNKESRNSAVRVWLETGAGYSDPHEMFGSVPIHDIRLDVGAPTFEEAVIKLAGRIRKFYGSKRRKYPKPQLPEGVSFHDFLAASPAERKKMLCSALVIDVVLGQAACAAAAGP